MPVFAYVDNGNGTVTASVTDAGIDPITLYAYAVPRFDTPAAIAELAANLEEGSPQTFTLGRGLYTFLGIPAGASLTDVVAQSVFVTDGDVLPSRVRDAVAATIEGLSLPGIRGVYRQWNMRDQTNFAFPCVILTVEAVTETDEPGTNVQDDMGYPVRVIICDRVSQFDHTKLKEYDRWRYNIANSFRRQRLAGVPEVKICNVEMDQISNPDTPQYDHMVSEFVIRAMCRQNRGSDA